ncbi:putative polyketide synthase [Aspergillus heteromorphus CBS 117.55]|uniref:Putative polyketide synthase n=1 Tax=Aspergillus heteromorphus CBS 117.55 TaxID=1448321 RepID=A0A317VDD2_9EURO|nr:putative polyketide synthase [Aspergillus heteromorphus CBS 117.55]PWY70902.1 putative polyketide synthase [Aspergillus heteromorphus CBS 117.55]
MGITAEKENFGEGARPPATSSPCEPIAIVGMAMRLPGGVHSGEEFWDMLIEKRSGLCDVPKDRFNIDAFHVPHQKAGTVRIKQAYFLDDVEIGQFDSSVFSSSKTEVERLDPQQQQLLEVVYECLENAGSTSWRGSDIGCYVGMFGEDWLDLMAKETQHMGGYRVTGYGDFVLGNRISYEFDLHGPSMTVKTGCSSSLVCLDLACKAIRDGDCDGALVGGTNLIFSPTMTQALTDQGVLSPTGTCKTFDAAADGYARGEAINVIYIKRLSQAIQDGDPIRAIIRGTSVNCDGRTQGMITPSPISQEAAIRRAYEASGIRDLSQTAIVECHGTGTGVGDPLEAAAVAKCFGEKGVVITSVKPNVGHSEGAAGLTSVIKAVLALEHRQVPPNINFTAPNPKIPFKECKLHVPVEVEAWPEGRAERVSVNSFGIGGANAHVILESPGQFGVQRPSAAVHGEGPHLMLFSAHSAESLESNIQSHRDFMKQDKASLRDIAYTLSSRRIPQSHRAYAVVDGMDMPPASGTEVAKSTPKVVWVFTGQGAQWPEMGVQLIETNAIFRNTIRQLDRFLLSLPTPALWTIEAELRKVNETSRVYTPEMGHPLSVAVQIGLIEILRSWGVTPSAVLGHSSGELSAAYASGAITAEGAMAAATLRGTSNELSSQKGLMAAIGLGRDEALPFVQPGVVIACENSQMSVTLSGDASQMENVVNKIKTERPEVLARFLRVEKAFHSHHMWEYGPMYEEKLQAVVHSVDPRIPFYSSVTGDHLTGEGALGASYWRRNMESPVLFNSGARSVLRDHPERLVLVEIGPHPALKGPIGQILRDVGRSGEVHVGTLQRGQFVMDLPRYSWKRDISHWAEPRVAREWRFREHPPHELLGNRLIELGSEPCWRNVLAMENVPWLVGHQLGGHTVFPAAGYICMIGEALRQLGGEVAYSLRNISIASAVVLETDATVELLTSLKPISLDASEKSPWYTFTINSCDGTRWTRNCYGEARPSVDKSHSLEACGTGPAFPRKVDENTWYRMLSQVGFNHTGLFRGLKQIFAAPVKNESSAVVSTTDSHAQAKYALHPGVIDQCFQLFTVSAYRGLTRDCHQLAVPTFIEEIVISPSDEELHVTALIRKVERGSFVGDLVAQASGQKMISLKGFKASAVSADNDAEETPLISRMEWKPHADFVDMSKLVHPREHCPPEWPLLEELVLLCMLDHQRQIQPCDETPDYLRSFFAWMRAHVERYQAGTNTFISNSLELGELRREERLARIEEIIARVSMSPYAPFAIAVNRLFQAAPTIFAGEAHPLHILMEDNVLTDLYVAGDVLDYAEALQVLGHTNPRLRILEIGAGTGGTTHKVLRALTSSFGERLYGSYTYTDISSGFMSAAEERFADYEGIEYAVFDITQDPATQGFELGKYDLIVGSNVVHATPSLQSTLGNLRALLSPTGRLFLHELCPGKPVPTSIKGFLSGWWLGASDNRVDEPYISTARWSKELVAAGFQAPEVMVLDGIAPYHASAGIMASNASSKTDPPRVTLLCYGPDGPYIQETRRRLEALNIIVDISLFGEILPPDQDVISLLDLQHFTIHDMSEATLDSILGYLQAFEGKIIWVTRASQINCEDPRAAMILGLARAARRELSIKLFTVELDSATPVTGGVDAITDILLRVSALDLQPDAMDPDWEYAIVDGDIHVPRLHWQTVSDAFGQCRGGDRPPVKSLTMKSPGLLHTMGWREELSTSPKEGEVVVQTRAVGLNFKDILISLGVLDNSTDELGLEGAGVVHAVGPGVQNIAVGDRVMYMASGCFTTHITLQESMCVTMDDWMTFEQAAALPCVYATASMALIDKAGLQPGQSILIHSACGGVGLAAIQIARMIGAEIYCTVGSETKAQYLTEHHHIHRSHIFNSRESTFLRDVMQATDNRGVDVVLNSLSGDLLHASWKCVADFGVMVEIGKRDFRRRAKLSMEAFEANRTFVGLDLWQISLSRPEKTASLLRRCVDWIRAGAIVPDAISHSFPAGDIQEAFRLMQAGRHIGKIVVNMPEDVDALVATRIKPTPTLRQDRSYLLVGGLGGLGRCVATWMVEHGARSLIFLSRSAGQGPDTRGFLDELHAQGCQAQLVPGDVGSMAAVEEAVRGAAMPMAGVVNMSMVLRDIPLERMTLSDWTAAVEPKVQGTWNLHHAVSSDLDFFILFSSYSGVAGHWNQANYGAANTFLDAFVQYRHHNGLPASVIDIGVMERVGYLSRNDHILAHFEQAGLHVLGENDLLNAMTLAVARSSPTAIPSKATATYSYSNPSQILLGLNTTIPLSSTTNRVAWKHDMRMSIYWNLNGATDPSSAGSSDQSSLREFLANAASRPAILLDDTATVVIATAVAGALAHFLIRSEETIALGDSLQSLGVDSLVAMEVRNWIRQQLGVETSVFTLMQSPSLLQLGEHIRLALVGKLGA